MCLATADASGLPSARIVLLKDHSKEGFLFYTNLESRKSQEINANHQAALCFYWMPMDRQVRIVGKVEAVAPEIADAYFASRVREKQLGAWASQQSTPLPSRDALDRRIEEYSQQFEGQSIPRPPHWSGWLVIPEEIEFWEQKEFRLHHRLQFTKNTAGAWDKDWLFP